MRLAEAASEAKSFQRKTARWLFWNDAAMDREAEAEFLEAEGDTAAAAAMKDELRWSCEIASGTDDQDAARLMAAKFIFDAEVIE